jgi:transposase
MPGDTPSEDSTGGSQRRVAIAKAGNRHVRRLLVESAWRQRHRPALSAPLRRRCAGQLARTLALADRARGDVMA